MELIFFDVDKTLVKGYSGFYTTLALIQHGVLKKRRIPMALFYRLIGPLHRGDPALLRKMYEIAIRDMAGMSLEEILKIGRVCFERWIRPRIYREAVDVIEFHRKQGDPVYLITSGPYMTIRILAEFLGVDGEYSAGPVIDDSGVLTSRLDLPVFYREGKVAAAEEAARKHAVALRDCHFYSDSIDDLFLLEKVGHPHLVNPDKKLKKIGRDRDWPILRFSQLLG